MAYKQKWGINRMSNPLNKNEFDVDYSGADPVDLGNIPASDFTKAKKKLIEDYGGEDNPDYLMDKGDYYWSKEKGKIRSGYTEYPEDAGDIEPRYLGKNWDNSSIPLNSNHVKKFKETVNGKIIEGEEISRDEFFHTGPYDYKTTKTYRDELRRVKDSLTNTGDIPKWEDQEARTAYYSGPHKKHSHLFPGRASLRRYASMSAEDQKKYFKKKNVKPTFPIK